MPKYFFSREQMNNNQVTFTDEKMHHLVNVLRLQPGEEVTLCDGEETDYKATFMGKKNSHTAHFEIKETYPCPHEPPFQITLYQALPNKADKLDLIIQKAVELGAHEIIPVETSHSIIKAKQKPNTNIRAQRIAQSAAEQSLRGKIPKVHTALNFEEAIKQIDSSKLHLVAHEKEKHQTLKSILCEWIYPPRATAIWIGPEGGFSDSEITILESNGAIPFTLGRRILRTETAAIATIAQILVLWE